MVRTCASLAVLAVASLGIAASPASALTMQECSAKYAAAKKDNSLGTKTWNDFRKSDCGQDAAATPAATQAQAKTEAKPEAKSEAKPAAPAKAAAAPKTAAKAAATAPAAAPAGEAKYPTAVDPKYAKETPGQSRMHSCLDQYNANKASNANGGMKWIQKGGGYYSECSKRLKGSA